MKIAYQTLLGIFLIVTLGLFLTTMILAIHNIPKSAQQVFGAADVNLSLSQKLKYSIQLLMFEQNLMAPVNPLGGKVQFKVELDESVDQITLRLQEARLISSKEGFILFLKYSGLDKRIRAGSYHLRGSMNSIDIARLIADSTPDKVKFIILPGMRSEEIAALIPTSGFEFSADQFLELVKNPDLLLLDNCIKGIKNLEGFLFPSEYLFNRDTNAKEFVITLINNCLQNISSEMIAGFQSQELNLYQGVVLASLLQREGMLPEERSIIASVFYNRLTQGMLLQSDPTVQYVLGFVKDKWWYVPLSDSDLQIDSPYNTYKYLGLPPTPICNPDLASIKAAAFPQKTEYLYFRSKCDNSGGHEFSKTYQEHLQKACK